MKRIYTCIVGDLFHAGHVNFLKQAKNEGNHLIVGVCSDEECEEKKRKTIMALKERIEVIQACRFVDQIVESPPSIINQEFMDKYKIDLIVHGDDNNMTQLKHFYQCAIEQGKYKSLPYSTGISTTEIIKRITDRTPEELQRKYFLNHLKVDE